MHFNLKVDVILKSNRKILQNKNPYNPPLSFLFLYFYTSLIFFFPFFFLFNISPLPRDYHARPAKREIKLLQLFFLVISTNASIFSHSLAPQMHRNKFEFHKSTGAPIRTYRPWAWLTAVKSGDVGSNLSMAATHLAISAYSCPL